MHPITIAEPLNTFHDTSKIDPISACIELLISSASIYSFWDWIGKCGVGWV